MTKLLGGCPPRCGKSLAPMGITIKYTKLLKKPFYDKKNAVLYVPVGVQVEVDRWID